MLAGAETVPKIDELRVVTVVVKLDRARFRDHDEFPHAGVATNGILGVDRPAHHGDRKSLQFAIGMRVDLSEDN